MKLANCPRTLSADNRRTGMDSETDYADWFLYRHNVLGAALAGVASRTFSLSGGFRLGFLFMLQSTFNPGIPCK
jgi:hypothetical protein